MKLLSAQTRLVSLLGLFVFLGSTHPLLPGDSAIQVLSSFNQQMEYEVPEKGLLGSQFGTRGLPAPVVCSAGKPTTCSNPAPATCIRTDQNLAIPQELVERSLDRPWNQKKSRHISVSALPPA
jgi:hypothetical protein